MPAKPNGASKTDASFLLRKAPSMNSDHRRVCNRPSNVYIAVASCHETGAQFRASVLTNALMESQDRRQGAAELLSKTYIWEWAEKFMAVST